MPVTTRHKHCWEPMTPGLPPNYCFDACRRRCCYCGESNPNVAATSEDDDLG